MTEAEFNNQILAEILGNWPQVRRSMTDHEKASWWRCLNRYPVDTAIRALRQWKDNESRVPTQSDIAANVDTRHRVTAQEPQAVDTSNVATTRRTMIARGEVWAQNASDAEIEREYWRRVSDQAQRTNSIGLVEYAGWRMDQLDNVMAEYS